MAPARNSPPYRLSLRLYIVFSLLMAVSAALSGLFLLYLARPFVSVLSSTQTRELTVLLFTGSAVAGALAAVGGLIVGLKFAGRIQGIVEKADALSHLDGATTRPPVTTVRDELGALDAAVGRLTLSMDRFIRDSDILARLPEGMLLVDPAGALVSFNATAETLLDLPLERFRGEAILSDTGAFPLSSGNAPLARLLEDEATGIEPVHDREVAVVTAKGQSLLFEITAQRRDWGRASAAQVLVFRDASEKRRIREEIRRADQLAFLGGMAARIAHEIRSPPSAGSSSCSSPISPRATSGASTSTGCSWAWIVRTVSWKTCSPSLSPSPRCGRRWPCRRRSTSWWARARATGGSSSSAATPMPCPRCGATPSGSPRCSRT